MARSSWKRWGFGAGLGLAVTGLGSGVGWAAVVVLVANLGSASLAAAADGLKPRCRGLMTRSGVPPENMSFIDSMVVQVNWSDLETSDQKFDGPGWAEIEEARRLGKQIRLRIMAGIHAPVFVKQLGHVALSDPAHGIDCSKSGGIAVWNPHDRTGGGIPAYWRPEVLDQYEQLMKEVARRYDDAPEICEVADSACMTVYAEPFYRAHSDPGSNTRLWQASLTFEKDRAAHERAIRIHNDAFRKTRTSLAINPWDIVDGSPGHHQASFEPTYEFVQWARQLMGEKLVLQNNGLGVDGGCKQGGRPASNHFCYLASIPGPKGFQTRTVARHGGEDGLWVTLDLALNMGANFVELPSGFQRYDIEKLRQYDEKLEKTP